MNPTGTQPAAAPHPRRPAQPLQWLGAVLLVLALSIASQQPTGDRTTIALFVPVSGAALALTLRSGLAMLPAIATGMLLASLLTGQIGIHALTETLSVVVMAWLASDLLSRRLPRSEDTSHLATLRRLVLWGCAAGPACGVLTGHALLWALGKPAAADHGVGQQLVQAWMGQALGVLLVTPLGLGLHVGAAKPGYGVRWQEAAALWLLATAACGIIFGYLHLPWAAPLANAYWMFLFVGWSAIRMGLPPTAALLCLIAWLAQSATNQRIGYFANDIAAVWGFGYWSYMTLLGGFGLVLTHYVADDRQQREGLRIAAATFEIAMPVLVTSRGGRVLQANTAFLEVSGLALPQVLGHRPADFLAPDAPQPPPFFFTPRDAIEQRLELTSPHRPHIPVWATVTPVREEGHAISHYVITLPDLTDFEAAQARQRLAEQAHREALVREVHHRIKNNLQGVIGMLRTLAQQHPALHEAIAQMATQVQSIALVHGLQGRSSAEEIDLAELVQAVAHGVHQALNGTLRVDTGLWPAQALLAPAEAVPIALVLNELMTNAIKHSGTAHGAQITLQQDQATAIITMSNLGHWPPPGAEQAPSAGHGLDLVRALLPRRGTRLTHETRAGQVVTTLALQAPVVHIVHV